MISHGFTTVGGMVSIRPVRFAKQMVLNFEALAEDYVDIWSERKFVDPIFNSSVRGLDWSCDIE